MNPFYFADRQSGIIGSASGKAVESAKLIESVKTGRGVLTIGLRYEPDARETFEAMVKEGGFIIFRGRRGAQLYGIMKTTQAVAGRSIDVYAESVGMNLLNSVAAAYTASSALTIAQYIALFTNLFTIRINEVSTLTRTLEWDGESTVAERLTSIANSFDAEIVYDVEIDGLEVTALYIDIYKKRGHSVAKPLYVGREVREVYVERSITDLATAILATGKDGLTLAGMTYDDGDIYLDANTNVLLSRTAQAEWTANMWLPLLSSEITKRFEVDTESQSILLAQAVKKLKASKETAVNYKASINHLPDDLAVGDTVTIKDTASGLTVHTRLVELSTELTTGRTDATFDEWEEG